jgi:DNA-binding LacI/PurR family transcriptional regulator
MVLPNKSPTGVLDGCIDAMAKPPTVPDSFADQVLKLGLPQKMPLYKQVANVLQQRIKRGDFDEDPNLPTVRQLATDLNVSHGVAQRALQHLQSQRLIESRPTIGTTLSPTHRDRSEATAFLFGFVQPSGDLWASALFQQLEHAAAKRQNLCVMRTSHDDAADERRIVEHLVHNGINGVILVPVHSEENRDFFREVMRQVPIVFVDRTLSDVAAPSAVLNYVGLAHEIVADFARRGCRRVLLAHDPHWVSNWQEFAAAFDQALREHGLAEDAQRFDWPLRDTIRSYQRQADNTLMEKFFRGVDDRVRRGGCDAVCCLLSEVMRVLFHLDRRLEDRRPELALATSLGVGVVARQARHLLEAGVTCWRAQDPAMLLQAIDMLQEMVMSRRPIRRQVRLPFLRVRDVSEMYEP